MNNYTETDWEAYQRRKKRLDQLLAMKARLEDAIEWRKIEIEKGEYNKYVDYESELRLLEGIRDGDQ